MRWLAASPPVFFALESSAITYSTPEDFSKDLSANNSSLSQCDDRRRQVYQGQVARIGFLENHEQEYA
jgi:hypothetical protein